MSISISTLDTAVHKLSARIYRETGFSVGVDVFRSGSGDGSWGSSHATLTVILPNDDMLEFEYTANGYGFPRTNVDGAEFGQSQKWSEMKAETLRIIKEAQDNLD